jgi:hypothetical protein
MYLNNGDTDRNCQTQFLYRFKLMSYLDAIPPPIMAPIKRGPNY